MQNFKSLCLNVLITIFIPSEIDCCYNNLIVKFLITSSAVVPINLLKVKVNVSVTGPVLAQRVGKGIALLFRHGGIRRG